MFLFSLIIYFCFGDYELKGKIGTCVMQIVSAAPTYVIFGNILYIYSVLSNVDLIKAL